MEARILVIEPDPHQAAELEGFLRDIRVTFEVARDSDEAWKCFPSLRPTHVLGALGDSDKGGLTFWRKLNSEYLGAMPRLFLTGTEHQLLHSPEASPDAYVTWPSARKSLARLFRFEDIDQSESIQRQIARIRELYDLNLLGPDLLRSMDHVAKRVALAFQVDNCVLWGTDGQSHWPRSTLSVEADEWPELRSTCELALHTSATTLAFPQRPDSPNHLLVEGEAAPHSLLAASIGPKGEAPVAGICLIDHGARLFTSEERDALRLLARRLSGEMAWMSAHTRLLSEHERILQSSMQDPLLGIWTRPALQQAIDRELATERDDSISIALLLLDYRDLRAVNDVYGHDIGDKALVHFAQTARAAIESDDYIGRHGGGEIAILLTDKSNEALLARADHIVDAIFSSPLRLEEGSVNIKLHAGFTWISVLETASDPVFARALVALDSAKKRGERMVALDSSHDLSNISTSGGDDLLVPGATLGGMYRIVHEISRGAMGVVYRGTDLGLGRPVAIKVLRPDLSQDDDLVQKFRSEASLLASLRHRNLVQVFSFGIEDDAVYFVMELVEGEPLSQIVRRLAETGEFVDLEAISKIIEEIADALDAIHSLGIVHRDVKPENVLVDRINDRAVLVDVGIAKKQGDARDAAGTPGYGAPECFMEADESPATDVYGLAATTFSLITGSQPFSGENLADLVNSQLNDPPPKASAQRDGLNPAIDAVLATALSADPRHRYRSANAFAVAATRALKRPSERRSRSRSRKKLATIPAPFKAGTTIRNLPESGYQVRAPTGAPLEADKSEDESRAAIFRVLGPLLTHRLSPEWYAPLVKDDPSFEELLSPTLAAQRWIPTSQLLRILAQAMSHPRCNKGVLHKFGGTLCKATLARFYGANPANQTPDALTKAAESYWRRYHNWGHLRAEVHRQEATLVVAESITDEALCYLHAGLFAQIPMLAGANASTCQIRSCRAQGDDECSFHLRWKGGDAS